MIELHVTNGSKLFYLYDGCFCVRGSPPGWQILLSTRCISGLIHPFTSVPSLQCPRCKHRRQNCKNDQFYQFQTILNKFRYAPWNGSSGMTRFFPAWPVHPYCLSPRLEPQCFESTQTRCSAPATLYAELNEGTTREKECTSPADWWWNCATLSHSWKGRT